eukprot:COSAG06_NODE_15272_length_1084_cov_1.884264_2_plen_148_part_00
MSRIRVGVNFTKPAGASGVGDVVFFGSSDAGVVRWDTPLPFPTPLHSQPDLSFGQSWMLFNNIWSELKPLILLVIPLSCLFSLLASLYLCLSFSLCVCVCVCVFVSEQTRVLQQAAIILFAPASSCPSLLIRRGVRAWVRVRRYELS